MATMPIRAWYDNRCFLTGWKSLGKSDKVWLASMLQWYASKLSCCYQALQEALKCLEGSAALPRSLERLSVIHARMQTCDQFLQAADSAAELTQARLHNPEASTFNANCAKQLHQCISDSLCVPVQVHSTHHGSPVVSALRL